MMKFVHGIEFSTFTEKLQGNRWRAEIYLQKLKIIVKPVWNLSVICIYAKGDNKEKKYLILSSQNSLCYQGPPANICGLINDFIASSTFVFIRSIPLWLTFYLKLLRHTRCLFNFQVYRPLHFRFISTH